MNKSLVAVLFSIFSFIILLSCDNNRILDQNIELDTSGWSIDDAQSFSFDIKDTNLRYNVLVNIRNSSNYNYRNLYLFIEMISPSNKFFKDTVEFQLADSKGKWLGSGVGNIWQNQLLLIKGAKMLEQGSYKVNIVHGMRDDTLQDISDVGLRIETINE